MAVALGVDIRNRELAALVEVPIVPLFGATAWSARQRLLGLFFAWNRKPVAYAPIDPATERALRERFAPDLQLLAELSGLDVGPWLPGGGDDAG